MGILEKGFQELHRVERQGRSGTDCREEGREGTGAEAPLTQVPGQDSFCPSSHGPPCQSVEAGTMMSLFPVPQFPHLQRESGLSRF